MSELIIWVITLALVFGWPWLAMYLWGVGPLWLKVLGGLLGGLYLAVLAFGLAAAVISFFPRFLDRG